MILIPEHLKAKRRKHLELSQEKCNKYAEIAWILQTDTNVVQAT